MTEAIPVAEVVRPQNPYGKVDRYKRALSQAFVDVFIDRDGTEKYDLNLINLMESGKSRYERVTSVLKIIDTIIPQVLRDRISKKFGYETGYLPFNPESYHLDSRIGSGGMNSVFLLSSQKEKMPSYVFKVNHASHFERDPDKLLELGKLQKKEYEEIEEKFKEIQNLIPPENYLIVHGVKKRKPALVMLQPFMGKNIRDIFNDIEKDELVYILEKNTVLKEQLSRFVQITSSDTNLINRELDILGKNNLVIVGEEGKERLVLLDPHFRSESSRGTETRKQIERRINYLKDVSDNAQNLSESFVPQSVSLGS